MGLGFRGLGFRGSGRRVQRVRFGVWGLAFSAWGVSVKLRRFIEPSDSNFSDFRSYGLRMFGVRTRESHS